MEIKQYIETINNRFKSGVATEHSYRGDLQRLLERLLNDIQITNEPKRISCGAPDYILTRKNVPVGYIEAKDVGKRLDDKSYAEQFGRYRKSLPNLIITDYINFLFYRDGDQTATVQIAKIHGNSILPLPENFGAFDNLIRDFVAFNGQTITSSSKLASMMAGKARLMTNVLANAIEEDVANDANTDLHQQLKAFRSILIHDIDPHGFADIYSQTIAYGLFAARLHDKTLESFSRQEAAELIPKSNPFLRKLFQNIAGPDLDERIDWIVDALADIFRATDVASLLKDFGKSTQRNDPFLHFYETFLAEYDPKLRKSRGVWYTPEPVVNFIVRAADDILKTEFGLSDGLADATKTTVEFETFRQDKRYADGIKKERKEVHRVQILDPATGTGTFLAEVVKLIHQKYSGQQGVWNQYVEDELIPRINGFELLMASYAMAHLKLELLLRDTGYTADSKKRLQVYLTNSLEEHHPDTGTLFSSWLSDEASEANHVKRDAPVMVVIGNPPYSGHSSNESEWIDQLLKDYKQEPGGGQLQETTSKWLNDDYVKFIRYGQHYIEKNGEGVLAYINNHSFLDNPTFRGMRWHLLKTFDKIYVIDLHGNSKKKESCPDGSPDKNVFDIQQGVSINIFVKNKRKKPSELGQVLHFDLYGSRESKYQFLWENSISEIPLKELSPMGPYYFFTDKNLTLSDEYEQFLSVHDLFTLSGNGIVTKRDNLTIHYSEGDAVQSAKDIIELEREKFYPKYDIPEDVRDWRYEWAKKDIVDNFRGRESVQKISYRPFDTRHIVYTGKARGFIGWPVYEVMQNYIDHDNYGLLISRMTKGLPFAHCFVTTNISEAIFLSSITSTNAFNHPLYVYPNGVSKRDLFSSTTDRRPNLKAEIVSDISEKLGLLFTPEKDKAEGTFAPIDLFDYIYAVLHSPSYRETYKEFLYIDFPRVPYPRDSVTFLNLVKLGGELRMIHLLKSPVVENYNTTYPISGSNEVTLTIGKNTFENINVPNHIGRVWINDDQYFDGVSKIAWDCYIGGYQPAQKWLKDRKGRTLTHNDIFHYQKIIVALMETDRLMREIDKALVF